MQETYRGLVGGAQQAMISFQISTRIRKARSMDTAPRGDCDGCGDCEFVDMARLSVFLHVADSGQQALRFSRRGRDRTLSTILRAPFSSADPPQMTFFCHKQTWRRSKGSPGAHILILHPPIRHFSLALRLRWSFPFDFMHSTSLCLYPLRPMHGVIDDGC
jgi:hypothetical protein